MGMAAVKKYLLGLVVLINSFAFADDGSNYVGARLGVGSIEVDRGYFINDRIDKQRTVAFHGFYGYRFNSGLNIEAGLMGQTSDNIIFDSSNAYYLSQLNMMLGYQIDVTQNLSFIPKIGISKWRFKARDEALINFHKESDEIERISEDGSDSIWEFVIGYKTSRFMYFDLAYERAEYDFGETALSKFGVRIDF